VRKKSITTCESADCPPIEAPEADNTYARPYDLVK
jgi:hypothetical protein